MLVISSAKTNSTIAKARNDLMKASMNYVKAMQKEATSSLGSTAGTGSH
jgi:hypothetical protein